MNKTMKKILLGTSLAAAGVAMVSALSYAVTDFMVDLALDGKKQQRVSPKAIKAITGSEKLSEFLEFTKMQGEHLSQMHLETIGITAEDGTKLIGHLYRHPKARRTIVAMHGWRSDWKRDFGMIADFWHRNGCNVLYVEQRAQGESGGEYMGFGMLERYDCLDWVHYLCRNGFDDKPMYLAGVSMGGATVLMSAAFDLPPCVKGIMADCAFTSAQDIWKHVAKNNMRMAYTGLHALIANDICKRKIQLGSADFTTTQAMKECKVPVLFIHGTDDCFVPVEMTYENYKACSAEKRLFVVPGADHGMSYFVDPKGYQTVMQNFWKDYDGPIAKI